MNFSELLERAEAWDNENQDHVVKLGDMQYGVLDQDGNLHPELEYSTKGNEHEVEQYESAAALFAKAGKVAVAEQIDERRQSSLNHNAHRQLVKRLQAPPIGWLLNEDKCPMELRSQILNYKIEHWEEQDKLLLLREHGSERGYIRAVLSDRYEKFDHFEYLQIIAEAIAAEGFDPDHDFRVERAHVSDNMYFYLSFPTDLDTGLQSFGEGFGGIEPGEGNGSGGIRLAVRVSNSETGRGMSKIAPAIWRMVCANGLYGWRSSEDEALGVRHVTNTKYAAKVLVADMISKAFDQTGEMAERFVQAQSLQINRRSLQDVIAGLTNKYKLPKTVKEGWVERFEGRPSTWFDHINHVTFTAQQQNEQTQEDMERMAGEMVYADLPARWLE